MINYSLARNNRGLPHKDDIADRNVNNTWYRNKCIQLNLLALPYRIALINKVALVGIIIFGPMIEPVIFF